MAELKGNKVGFDLVDNTLVKKPVVEDIKAKDIEVEIGDSKQLDFKPQFKVKRWDNDANFSMRAEEDPAATVSIEGDIVKYKTSNHEVHQYEKPEAGEDGGFEFEWVLNSVPEKNVFTATIQTKNLNFFYQPALTEEEVKDGRRERPDNVVGSYAVYHSSKKDNEYKTGKAFHIYRPEAVDAEGNRIWGELNIDQEAGLLTVTVDEKWLKKASYPVVIDPTFGYTSAGGSTFTTDKNAIGAGFRTEADVINGEITSVTSYVSAFFVTPEPYVFMRLDSVADSPTDDLVGSLTTFGSASATNNSPQWVTVASSFTPTAGRSFYIVTLSSKEGTSAELHYDTVSGTYGYYESDNPTYGAESGRYADTAFSVYATYTTTFTVDTSDSVGITDEGTFAAYEQQAYYFDGHNLISDPFDNWGSEANAFDGDDTTRAVAISNSILIGNGTNSPTSGWPISLVRFRIKRASSEGFLPWSTLTAPGGGWTWSAVSNLESKTDYVGAMESYIETSIYASGGGSALGVMGVEEAYGTLHLYKIEIEVTSAFPTTTFTVDTSDSVGITESVTVFHDYDREVSVSDSIGVAETASLTHDYPREVSVSDSVGITETASNSTETFVSVSDSVGITETASLTHDYPREVSVSDAVGITEDISSVIVFGVDVSDSLTISEVASTENTIDLSAVDTLSITESTSTGGTLAVSVSDSIDVTEYLDYYLLIPCDSSLLQEDGFDLLLEDGGGICLDTPPTVTMEVNVSDSLTITETQEFERSIYLELVDAIAVSEVVAPEVNSSISVTDSIGITESTTEEIDLFADTVIQEVNDSVAISESIQTSVTYNANVSDSIGITEVATSSVTIDLAVSDDISIEEFEASEITFSRSVYDDVSIAEYVDGSLVFNQSVSDSVSISDVVIGTQIFFDVDVFDEVSITEDTASEVLLQVAVVDQVAIEEDVNPNQVFFGILADTITVTEEVTLESIRFSPELQKYRPRGIGGYIKPRSSGGLVVRPNGSASKVHVGRGGSI